MKNYILLLALCGLFLSACSIDARSREERAAEIASGLRCPVCQGLSVEESKIGISVDMKNKIFEMIDAGSDDEEIYQYFEQRYGEWIRRVPKKSGFNLLLWVLPGIFVLLSIFVVARNMINSTKPDP